MNDVNILWIIFWVAVSAGWSVLSFQWLKRSVAMIQTPQPHAKPDLSGLILRRVAVFLIIALLIFLALKTEPIAAIAMAVTITVVTWLQVILYNVKLNKQEEKQKEKHIGSN
ncbi:MAG: hypothetical protein GX797_02800 [Chloroflexi bacterium]|nr:hypothetical protein [Chloroflexota bacterium]